METIYTHIDQLVSYALANDLIERQDKIWAINELLAVLQLTDYHPSGARPKKVKYVAELLKPLCDWAAAHGLISPDTITQRDLFDTKLMNIFAARPSEVNAEFAVLYKTQNPRAATDKFYKDARALNYIRTDRVAKNIAWKADTPYGQLDITINMSKPEKDPKDIAAALQIKSSGYPKCLLCKENEGYAGHAAHPARQNIRLIELDLLQDGQPWYLQYSPYVYYNEHCIFLSQTHEPMKISKKTFARLLGFVELLPHYFIGSNADLPIVGGSILTHDHFQGGRYSFAMEQAPVERKFSLKKFPRVKAGIVRWPMSVIRLTGSKADLISAADEILQKWRKHSDKEANLIAFTGKLPHNTITPIARRRGKLFEIDLVLRNNRTTKEFPLGIFHPHKEVHHIKKENIGLIEVLGLAILPARLSTELTALAPLLIKRDVKTIEKDPVLQKHAPWAADLLARYTFTSKNVQQILRKEVANVFVTVLEHAGVYKRTAQGQGAFDRFLKKL